MSLFGPNLSFIWSFQRKSVSRSVSQGQMPHKCAPRAAESRLKMPPPGHLSLGPDAPFWAQMLPSQELVLLFLKDQTFFYRVKHLKHVFSN